MGTATRKPRERIALDDDESKNPFGDLLSLEEAARLLPGNVAPSTVWRWIVHGIVRNGTPIKLDAKRAGRRVYTTASDLARFMTRCAAT